MTQEEKDLIVKDLSSRIPYGVMVYIEFDDGKIFKIRKFAPIMIHDYIKLSLDKVIFKPYLRSLSSMTNKEKSEFELLWNNKWGDALDAQLSSIEIDDSYVKKLEIIACCDVIDWLNTNHFDYRGLIEKGLAIEAPEGMYNTK